MRISGQEDIDLNNSPPQYYLLKLWFRSQENPIIFKTAEAAWIRFKRTFAKKQNGYFICATITGRTLAINLSHIQLAQTYPLPADAVLKPLEERDTKVHLHFAAGNQETFEALDSVELAEIFTKIRPIVAKKVLTFTDSCGGSVMVQAEDLMIFDVSTAYVEEGFLKIYQSKSQ